MPRFLQCGCGSLLGVRSCKSLNGGAPTSVSQTPGQVHRGVRERVKGCMEIHFSHQGDSKKLVGIFRLSTILHKSSLDRIIYCVQVLQSNSSPPRLRPILPCNQFLDRPCDLGYFYLRRKTLAQASIASAAHLLLFSSRKASNRSALPGCTLSISSLVSIISLISSMSSN